eukprot:1142621-Prymnesium_polylepis.1
MASMAAEVEALKKLYLVNVSHVDVPALQAAINAAKSRGVSDKAIVASLTAQPSPDSIVPASGSELTQLQEIPLPPGKPALKEAVKLWK